MHKLLPTWRYHTWSKPYVLISRSVNICTNPTQLSCWKYIIWKIDMFCYENIGCLSNYLTIKMKMNVDMTFIV